MPSTAITRRALALGAAALALPFATARAGAHHPLIVAFPPGGPVDFVARTIAEALGKELGQQVIVENKAGANGAIAAEYVSRAAPDATTLWLTSVGAVAINPALYDKLPYDAERDLVPVSLVVNNVEVLVVGANAPYNTGAEFVAAAKAAGLQAHAGLVGHRQRAAPGDGTAERRRQDQRAARALQGRRAGHHRRDRRPRERLLRRHPGPHRPHQERQGQGHRPRGAAAPSAAAAGAHLRGDGRRRRRLGQLVCAVRLQGHAGRCGHRVAAALRRRWPPSR
jgi:hypothetical protein